MSNPTRPSPHEPAAAHWVKSSYSGPDGNDCVEVADLDAYAGIRDSKASGGATLVVPGDAFTAFLTYACKNV